MSVSLAHLQSRFNAIRSDSTTIPWQFETIADAAWQLADEKLAYIFEGHTDNIFSLDFSPDGAMLVSSSLDSTVRLWQISDGTLLHTLPEHTQAVVSVAFSPDGKLIVSGSADGTIRLWGVQ